MARCRRRRSLGARPLSEDERLEQTDELTGNGNQRTGPMAGVWLSSRMAGACARFRRAVLIGRKAAPSPNRRLRRSAQNEVCEAAFVGGDAGFWRAQFPTGQPLWMIGAAAVGIGCRCPRGHPSSNSPSCIRATG